MAKTKRISVTQKELWSLDSFLGGALQYAGQSIDRTVTLSTPRGQVYVRIQLTDPETTEPPDESEG